MAVPAFIRLSDSGVPLDLLRAAVVLVAGLGHAPASTAQAHQILGIPPAPRFPLGPGS